MDNGNRDMNRPEDNSKEWKLIEKMVTGLQAEQRRSRRWNIFFRSLIFIYLFALLWMVRLPTADMTPEAGENGFAAIVEVNGAIAADQPASADLLITAIRNAFDSDAKGLILRINSPGGSPVQAGYVFDEIRRLKATRPDFPVYAVIMDLGASGAYYIAAAADEIYADKASLVGSIGVVGSGFGFTGVMEKLGVERRTYTSGEHKGFLDPFQPEREDERAFWESVLKVTHQQFIEQVRLGRGERLKETPDMFSGLVWSGEQAVELGLVDGLASSSQIARDKLNTEQMVNYTFQEQPWKELVGQLGISIGEGISRMLTQQQWSLR